MLIAQITDLHIVAKGSDWLGLAASDTAGRLQLVIERLNHLRPRPDLVLITGDLVENGAKEEYAHLKEILAHLTLPYYVIPGNHDDRENLRQAFSEASYIPDTGFIHYVIDHLPVRLIGLDTMVPGKAYGLLCKERLKWLEDKLAAKKPTFIFMHHFPVQVGQSLFDEIICISEGNRFEQIITNHTNTIGIITGHYHHPVATSFAGKPCFISPSVAPAHYFDMDNEKKVLGIELTDPYISLHKFNAKLTTQLIAVNNHQLPFEPFDK